MFLNEYIADIKKSEAICFLTFAVNEYSGLLLHPSIFSIIHSESLYIKNDALWNF